MWAKVFDFIAGFFGQFQCWLYIPQFERVVVLRKGIFHRLLEPGARGIIPFSVEQAIHVNVVPEPIYLDVQSLHTKDEYACNVQIGFTWRIVDPKKYTLDFEDTESIITMVTSGIVTETVHETTWAGMKRRGFAQKFQEPFNSAVSRYGVEIDEVIMQDFTTGIAERIWHEGISLELTSE